MNRIIIVFAHPRYEHSRVNRALLSAVSGLEGVTICDLYEEYADFNIEVEKEKERLISHDVIVWQFPLYLYAPPALLKHWFELVLEFGWAYGKGGNKLKGKKALSCVTTGGSELSFSSTGHHRLSLREYLRPIEQISYLCGLKYLPPFVVYGSYLVKEDELTKSAARYRELIEVLRQGGEEKDMMDYPTLNEWLVKRDKTHGTVHSV